MQTQIQQRLFNRLQTLNHKLLLLENLGYVNNKCEIKRIEAEIDRVGIRWKKTLHWKPGKDTVLLNQSETCAMIKDLQDHNLTKSANEAYSSKLKHSA